MADWQRTLPIKAETNQFRRGEITIQQLASSVAVKLRTLKPFNDPYLDDERDNIIDEFDGVAGDPTATVEDYDSALTRSTAPLRRYVMRGR